MKLLNEQHTEFRMEHLVFDIKRFAVHDGPGIRTTVFLKACALHCPWCQNPEGLDAKVNLMYDQLSCIACHLCVDSCPENAISPLGNNHKPGISINKNKCNLCGACIKVCPSQALKFDAQLMTPEMILEEVLKDQIFYKQDNGGVTFSGGDPLYNSSFLKKCVELCKSENLHVALETNMNYKWSTIDQFIGLVDLFITDIKIFDENTHNNTVGGSGLLIKGNIRKLNNRKEHILLRTPLIPGYTATSENLKQIGVFYKELAQENENIKFELLNYNPYAISKYKKQGLPFDQGLNKKKYSDEEMNEFYKFIWHG